MCDLTVTVRCPSPTQWSRSVCPRDLTLTLTLTLTITITITITLALTITIIQ